MEVQLYVIDNRCSNLEVYNITGKSVSLAVSVRISCHIPLFCFNFSLWSLQFLLRPHNVKILDVM